MNKFFPILMLTGLTLFILSTAAAQDLSQYEVLKEPRITQIAAQKMLVVEAKGDPNVTAGDAFSHLFKTFFSLRGVKMAPPRARWLQTLSTPKEEWIGLYALPLPESITELPAEITGARMEEWKYGAVAEILHIGAYSEETPTINKLHRFIEKQGYEITGPHEEEYLKGPGQAKTPAEYWTIIRYQVGKKN